MIEKIKAINEIDEIEFNRISYAGYEIETNIGKRYILISNGQSCCESFGYLVSEDDVNLYVGATLTSFKLTDENKMTKILNPEKSFDAGGVIFVDLETDKGNLQFAVYNAHNGYYGHNVLILGPEVRLDDSL